MVWHPPEPPYPQREPRDPDDYFRSRARGRLKRIMYGWRLWRHLRYIDPWTECDVSGDEGLTILGFIRIENRWVGLARQGSQPLSNPVFWLLPADADPSRAVTYWDNTATFTNRESYQQVRRNLCL